MIQDINENGQVQSSTREVKASPKGCPTTSCAAPATVPEMKSYSKVPICVTVL